MCVRFCLCPPRLESLFPPVLWKSCNQIPLAFKVRFPGDSQALCWIPRLRSLIWSSDSSQQWGNFFGIIVLQFVGHPPSEYGIWFYCDCVPLNVSLWLPCLWAWGIFFFGGSQHPTVSGCLTACCDVGALAGGNECTSFYSTILKQRPLFLIF